MFKKTVLIILIFMSALSARKLQYKQYNVGQGLIQSHVRSITQMNTHEMVFSTASGISIYDGVKFYTPDNPIFTTYVTTVANVDGDLWLGTFNEGIYVWNEKKEVVHFGIDSFLPGMRINKIKKHKDKIYIGTGKGLVILSKSDTLTINEDSGLNSSIIIDFFIDNENNIWVTSPYGFSVITFEKQIINVTQKNLFKNPFCQAILVDNYGKVWIGTREGLIVFDKKPFIDKKKIFNPAIIDKKIIHNDFINKIMKDRFGDIWIGTKHGVAKYEYNSELGKNTKKIDVNNFIYYSLNHLFAKEIFIDKEENIWIGTRGGGAIKIQGDIFWTYGLEDGMDNQEILAIYQTYDKKMWFGTNSGMAMFNGRDFKVFNEKNGMPHNVVSSFYETAQNKLLIGTWNGLALLQGSRIIPFPNNKYKKQIPFKIFDIIEKREKQFWLATNMGLQQFDFDTKSYSKIDLFESLSNQLISQIFFENDSTVYFVTVDDIIKGNTQTGKTYSLKSRYKLPSDHFTSVQYMKKMGLLIGSRHGLFCINSDTIAYHLHTQNYLADNWVMSILVVNDNQFWLGGDKGVSLIQLNEEGEFFSRHYSSKNGFIGEEIITRNSMFVDADENVWFGTFLGVSKYIKGKDIANNTPPYIKIENLSIFEKKASQKTTLELKYNQNTISIQYVGISFRDERDVVYKYRLLGHQEEWSDITKSREVNFYNLKSGEYTFQVIARNRDGIWSETPASTRINILKPFWETRLFYSFIIIVIFLFLYFIFRRKFLKVEREKKILERKVNERTKTLIEQQKKLLETNNELEKLTINLKDSMEQLKNAQLHMVQSEKMASLGTLIAGVTHELNNPVTFIYSNFNSLKDYLESILKIIEDVRKDYLKNDKNMRKLFSDEDVEYILDDLPQLLSGIEYGTNRIKDIVMQLYRFSHPGQNNEKVHIEENLDLTLDLFLNQYRRQVNVHKDYQKVPIVEVPGGELNQVLLNLLVNSAHAIIKTKGQGNIWIKTFTEGHFVTIIIKDDGGGVPEHIKEKIFDPFYTTKPIGEGTGLGLSLSYTILQNMGGSIGLRNHQKGAEFFIKVPFIAKRQKVDMIAKE